MKKLTPHRFPESVVVEAYNWQLLVLRSEKKTYLYCIYLLNIQICLFVTVSVDLFTRLLIVPLLEKKF